MRALSLVTVQSRTSYSASTSSTRILVDLEVVVYYKVVHYNKQYETREV